MKRRSFPESREYSRSRTSSMALPRLLTTWNLSYYIGKQDDHKLHTGSVLDTRVLEVIPNVLREVEQLAHEPLHPRPQFRLAPWQADCVDRPLQVIVQVLVG